MIHCLDSFYLTPFFEGERPILSIFWESINLIQIPRWKWYFTCSLWISLSCPKWEKKKKSCSLSTDLTTEDTYEPALMFAFTHTGGHIYTLAGLWGSYWSFALEENCGFIQDLFLFWLDFNCLYLPALIEMLSFLCISLRHPFILPSPSTFHHSKYFKYNERL